MASLADFCATHDDARILVRQAWLFPDRKLAAASNGFLIIARRMRRGERLEPAPPEVERMFSPWIDFRPSPNARQVRIRELRRWCGRGLWPRTGSLCRQGRVDGQLINCNWLALLLGRVTDARGKYELVKTETGTCLSLVSKNWNIHLMGLMETALGEGHVVPSFRG